MFLVNIFSGLPPPQDASHKGRKMFHTPDGDEPVINSKYQTASRLHFGNVISSQIKKPHKRGQVKYHLPGKQPLLLTSINLKPLKPSQTCLQKWHTMFSRWQVMTLKLVWAPMEPTKFANVPRQLGIVFLMTVSTWIWSPKPPKMANHEIHLW